MGGMWPEEIWIEARLDTDGNVMSKDDAISSGIQGPLVGTQTDVALQIVIPKDTTQTKEETDSTTAIVSGTIQATDAPSGIVFLIARRSEGAKGPPVAVRKIVASSFPLSFSMGKEHLMMGGTWPEEVWLEARLDLDGDAMTKDDKDWYSKGIALKGNVSGVSLELFPK